MKKIVSLLTALCLTAGCMLSNALAAVSAEPNNGVMRNISARELVNDIKVGFNFGADNYYNMVGFWKDDEDYAYTSLPVSISVNGEGFKYQLLPKGRLLRKGDSGLLSIRLPSKIESEKVPELLLDFSVPYLKGGIASLNMQFNDLNIITESGEIFPIDGVKGNHAIPLESHAINDGYWVESPAIGGIPIPLPYAVQDAKLLENAELRIDLSVLDAPTPDELHWSYILGIPNNLRYFDEMKKAGYNAVRINTTLADFMNLDTGKISDEWFTQTEKLVSYITGLDMYCLLTIHDDYAFYNTTGVWVGDHFDTDWLVDEYKPFIDKRWEYTWTQIANHFKNYSDYLIFQSANEPGMEEGNSKLTHEELLNISVRRLNELNGVFVKAVRATGGNNSKRILNIAGCGYAPVEWDVDDLVLPDDDRVTLSVHCYPTPNDAKSWSGNNPDDIAYVDSIFDFISEFQNETNIPVLLDEWGSTRYMDADDRIDLTKYFIGKAKSLGVPCFYWEDNYAIGGFDEKMVWSLHFDMQNKKWEQEEIVNAMMAAVYEETETSSQSHETGNFRDMDVETLLSEIGPGYSVGTILAEHDPRLMYDSSTLAPVNISIAAGNTAGGLSDYSKRFRLELNKTSTCELDLKNLPEPENGLEYDAFNINFFGRFSFGLNIKNAKLVLPEKEIDLPYLNGDFEFSPNELKPDEAYGGYISHVSFNQGELGEKDEVFNNLKISVSANELRRGKIVADFTVTKHDGTSKAVGYNTLHTQYAPNSGAPIPTSDWFAFLKTQGFNSIRFQVTWYNHTDDATYKIDGEWLDEVEKYVNMATEQGLYCSINLNWDMAADGIYTDWYRHEVDRYGSVELPRKRGWLTLEGDRGIEERYAAIWKQIAERFKNYDEYLLFESINEPEISDFFDKPAEYKEQEFGMAYDSETGWWSTLGEAGENLNRLNQIFVDTVRKTGGNNAKRFLIVPTYYNKAYETALKEFTMPKDNANKTIAAIHLYLGDQDGHAAFNQARLIDEYLLSKDIGVIVNEIGADLNVYSAEQRFDYVKNYIPQLYGRNIPVQWYNWGMGGENFSSHGLYNDYTFEPLFPDIIKILIEE